MSETITEIARQLAEQAEAVCRHYLPAGRRERHQWRVGDVNNTPGRSLFVRLVGPASGRNAAGRWRDAANDEHGDLIDLIKQARGLPTVAQALTEARRFLGHSARSRGKHPTNSDNSDGCYDAMTSVKRLVAESTPIEGTLAESYLRHRAIAHCTELDALRFHPRCPYRDPNTGRFSQLPALLAMVTDLKGNLTGLQRTYLSSNGDGKANLLAPRRSLGVIRRHGARFGVISDVGVFGEGVETVLSLKCAMPSLPMTAALSADNLAASVMPSTLRRLYIAVDPDPAGLRAADTLIERSRSTGVHAVRLMPTGEDFNADLMEEGVSALRQRLADQLLAEDLDRLNEDHRRAAAISPSKRGDGSTR